MIDFVILCVLLVLCTIALVLAGVFVFFLGTILLPIAFVAIVVIWLIEWRGVNLTRRRFGKLQLPIITLREKNTGNLVRLVGVVHIAESAYWKKLTGFIEQYPHSAVLYEGVSKVSEEEKLRFTENELAVWKQFDELGPAMKEIGVLMGLTFQKEGLPYPENWIRTDMTGFDFVRAYAANSKADDNVLEFPKFLENDKPLLHWLIRSFIAHMPFFSLVFGNRKKSKARDVVIIHLRNIIGCEAIKEYRDKGDVISVWGGGHIPGMVHLLEQMEYEVIDTDWHNVINGNTHSLLDALRDMAKAAKEKAEKSQGSTESEKTRAE